MTKLSLLVFVFSIIAKGYLQEVSNSVLEPPSNNDNSVATKQLWLQQFQGQRRSGKPCPRRSNGNLDGPWIPSYSSQITHPLYDPAVLQPQALRNEDVHRTNDLTDDDCDDQLSAVKPGSANDPSTMSDAALKQIEDCLKKQHKNHKHALESGRRSMSDPESGRDFEIDNLLNVDDEDANNRRLSQTNSLQDKNTNQQLREGTGLGGSGRNLDNYRICYACSTATNPTCWTPDKRTTIKYCSKEQSCVTKTFGVKNQQTLIRDCANSCADTSVLGIEPKYKSCHLCHTDYCNSAMGVAINIYSLAIILIISIVKCTY